MEISANLTSVDVILSELETLCFSIFRFSHQSVALVRSITAVTLISRLQFLVFDIDQLKQLTTTHRIVGKNRCFKETLLTLQRIFADKLVEPVIISEVFSERIRILI